MEISRRMLLKKGLLYGSCYAALPLTQLLDGNDASDSMPSSESIIRGDKTRKKIALTFDGGSGDNAASHILQSLREHSSLSTFFLTGEFVRKYPDTAKRIHQSGHEIGNHTYSHPHLTKPAGSKRIARDGVDKNFVRDQLSRANGEFYRVCGGGMAPLWRAPYGEENREIREWANEVGYQHVGWSFDTLDWVDDESDRRYFAPKSVEERLIRTERVGGLNGYIILMHLGTSRKKDSFHKTLPALMETLQGRGYSFGKVSEVCSIF